MNWIIRRWLSTNALKETAIFLNPKWMRIATKIENKKKYQRMWSPHKFVDWSLPKNIENNSFVILCMQKSSELNGKEYESSEQYTNNDLKSERKHNYPLNEIIKWDETKPIKKMMQKWSRQIIGKHMLFSYYYLYEYSSVS